MYRFVQNQTASLGLHREWFCLQSQWVSDFGAHPAGGSGNQEAGVDESSEQAATKLGTEGGLSQGGSSGSGGGGVV